MTKQGRLAGLARKNIVIEDSNGAFCELSKFIERANNRLTINNLVIAKRYLNCELRIVIGFVLRAAEFENYCTFFQREHRFIRNQIDRWEAGDFTLLYSSGAETKFHPNVKINSNRSEGRANRDYHPMLVQDVESVDFPKYAVIPTLIWLE